MTTDRTMTTATEEDDMEHRNATNGRRGQISLGRAMLLGGLLGGAAVWAATTWLALGHEVALAEALAFGAFVGLWGGGGLGSMVAATIPLSRLLPVGDGARTPSHAGDDR
jgi:hypothetical protein